MRINALTMVLFLGLLGCADDDPLRPAAEEFATAPAEQTAYEAEEARIAERRLAEARRWMRWAEEKGLESGRDTLAGSDWYMAAGEFLGIMEAPAKATFWDLERARGTARHVAYEMKREFDWEGVTEEGVVAVTNNVPCEFKVMGVDGYQNVYLDNDHLYWACSDLLEVIERLHTKWA